MTKILTSLVALGLSAGFASAASIGVSFMSDRNNPDAQLAPGESAGAPGFAQTNWNTNDGGIDAVAGANGSTTSIISPLAGQLVDSTGAGTGVTVDWTSNGTWNTSNGFATGDSKLMNGYVDAIGGPGAAQIVMGNLNSHFPDGYTAVLYFGSDGNGRTGQVQGVEAGVTYGYSTFSNDPSGGGGFDSSDYLLTTDTVGNPNANYAVFSDLSGDTQTFNILRGSSNSGFHGIQIIPVPEPSLTAFLGASGLGLLFRRRRNRILSR